MTPRETRLPRVVERPLSRLKIEEVVAAYRR